MGHSGHLLYTLILYVGLNQGAHDSCNTNSTSSIDPLGYNETAMQFTAFKVLEDSVVFDWFITLDQKERYYNIYYSNLWQFLLRYNWYERGSHCLSRVFELLLKIHSFSNIELCLPFTFNNSIKICPNDSKFGASSQKGRKNRAI